MKKFIRLTSCFALSFSGYALAAVSVPSVPNGASTLSVRSIDDWNNLENSLKFVSGKNVIIRIGGDTRFSSVKSFDSIDRSTVDKPNQIDANGLNVYIVGENGGNRSSLGGIVIDGSVNSSLLTNIGDTLYIGNLDLKDNFIISENIADSESFGLFAGSAKNVFVNNVRVNNAIVGMGDDKTPITKCGFFAASAGSFTALNVSVDSLNIEGVLSKHVGGLVATTEESFSVDSCSFKNMNINNTFGQSMVSMGGLVGSVGIGRKTGSFFTVTNSSISINDSLLGAFYIDNSDVYVGGLAGRVLTGYVTVDNDSLSGSLAVVSSNKTYGSVDYGFYVGGAVGSWNSNLESSMLQTNNTSYNVNVNFDFLNSTGEVSFAVTENTIKSRSAVGGAFGSISSPGSAYFINDYVGGKVSYSSNREDFSSVGGLIGFGKSTKVTMQSLSAEDTVKTTGSYVSAGGLLGTLQASDGLSVKGLSSNIVLNISLQKNVEHGAVGGVVGIADDVKNVDVEGSSVKASIEYKNYLNGTVEAGITSVSVGGVVGSLWNESFATFSGVDFNGFVYVDNFVVLKDNNGLHSPEYIGGLVGSAMNSSMFVSASSVKGSKSDSLISAKFQNATHGSFVIGGMLGYAAGNESEDVSISNSFVAGDIHVAGVGVSEKSFATGMVGSVEKINSLKMKDLYYRGFIKSEMEQTPEMVSVVGLAFANDTKEDVHVGNGYLYDMGKVKNAGSEIAEVLNVTGAQIVADRFYKFIDYLTNFKDFGSYPASPAFAYYLNSESAGSWMFDPKQNGGLPMLTKATKGDAAEIQSSQKVTLKNFEIIGTDTLTYEIYADNNGNFLYAADGSVYSNSSSVYGKSTRYNELTDKMEFWKSGDVIWNGLENTQCTDGMVFVKYETAVPTPIFDRDPNETFASPIIFWDGDDYSIATDEKLPSVVFMVKDHNGDSSYYKGNVWKIAGEPKNVSTSAELYEYIVTGNNVAGYVKLEFNSEASLLQNQKYQTKVRSQNATSMTLNYTVMGIEKEVTFNPEIVLLPRVETLSIVNVGNDAETSTFRISVSGEIIDSAAVLEQKFDFSDRETLDTITIYQIHYTYHDQPAEDSIPEKTPSSDDTNSVIPSVPGEVVVPDTTPVVVDRTPECEDSAYISKPFVETSGSAALFGFDLYIPKFCKDMKPTATVLGPDGYVLEKKLESKSNSYEFELYPLDPGSYTFKVKLTSKKQKKFTKTFSSEIAVKGRTWTMVALGSWPKNALKGEKATIYAWNPEVAIGDYWQYEAFPKASEADETMGYWLKSEKNLKIALETPLKKAEGDSLKWNLKKKFNGWNMVANPYSWNLYAGSVAGFKSAESDKHPFWRWNVDSSRYDIADTLYANDAFWINTDKNRSVLVSTKPVFPNRAVAETKSSKKKSLKKSAAESWSMMLIASANGSSDCWNVFGVGSKDIAISEPPAGMESSVEVSFVGEQNNKLAKRILAKGSSDEMSWNVSLKNAESGEVTLTLDGLEDVKAMGYRAVFIMDGETYEWNDNSSISVKASAESKVGVLKVVPASAKVIASKGIHDVNINVASGEVAVQFSVATAGQAASVKILDVNGKVVSMVRGKSKAGINSFNLGAPVRSGVYVLQLRVGSDSRSVRVSF